MNAKRWACIFILFSLPAFPQQSVVPSAASPDLNRRIVLDVVVSGKSEKPVSGLQEQDFTVLDNKQPLKLVSFQAMEHPAADPLVKIILLVDRVNTSFSSAGLVREQMKKFLRENGGELDQPVSMIFFSDSGTTDVQKPTHDGNALAAALDASDSSLRTSGRSQGIYGAVDRLQMSLSTLNSIAANEANTPGRKLLIWLSPGWPMLAGPRVQLSSKSQQEVFKGIVATSTLLRQARIALYSVDTVGVAGAGGLRSEYYLEFVKGVRTPRQAQAGDLALPVIAYQTGGRVLTASNDIPAQIARAEADANAYYVLSFDSPPADGPNEYHALDVKIGKPGLTARTRTGYYAQP
jgi:VWFA-related protein